MPTGNDDRAIVVLVGDSPWHAHRLAAQYIAEGLTRYADVLYVDPPVSPSDLRRLRRTYGVGPWIGVERLATPGLHRLGVLVNPGRTRFGGRRAAGWLYRHRIRRTVKALAGDVHAVIQIPIHYPLLGMFGEGQRVHLASDDFVAAAKQNRVDEDWVRGCEERIARTASTVVAVSDALVERWRRQGFDPILIPNGCDLDLYATTDDALPATDVTLPAPMAGFIGTISDRTDATLLEALAERGHRILLVGPRSPSAPNEALDDLFARPNVQWVGPRDHTELPRYLRHVKVGLVPYRLTEFNLASFPLKILDYLAAGRAVVSTDLPAVQAIGADLVAVGSDSEDFVDKVEILLDEPDDPDARRARRDRAALHSWHERVAELARAIGLDIEAPAR